MDFITKAIDNHLNTIWNTNDSRYHECLSIGANTYGQQDNGTRKKVKKLTKMSSLPNTLNITNITTGGSGTTYILCNNNKTLIVCGFNEYGQLSIKNELIKIIVHSDITNHEFEFIAVDIINLISIFCGEINYNQRNTVLAAFIQRFNIDFVSQGIVSNHKFVVTKSGELYGVGNNKRNQLGLALKQNTIYDNRWGLINVNDVSSFKKIEYFEDKSIKLSQIQCGIEFTVFLSTNGELFVCGFNGSGLGIEWKTYLREITKINMDTKIKYICCGSKHTLAINENNQLYGFGGNQFGQIGIKYDFSVSVPKLINYFHKGEIKYVCCGASHSVVLDINGRIYTFGRNWDYECGDGTNTNIETPKINKTLENIEVVNVKSGTFHNMVKTIDNEYWLWGYNDCNQCLIYDDRIEHVSIPTKIDMQKALGDDVEIVAIYPGCRETRVIIVSNNQQQ